MRDLVNNLGAASALTPAVQSATVKSSAVDTSQFDSLMFLILTGAIAASGNFTATVQESDTTTDGDFTDAPAAHVIGSTAVNPLTADGIFKVGYTGYKRYARVVMTKNSGTSIIAGVLAVKGNARYQPVA